MKKTKLALGATVLLLAALVVPQPAAADVTKTINYAKSLTGDCNVRVPDTVLDPGCPGGDHPGSFGQAGAVAVGKYGETYVVNRNRPAGEPEGANDRINIFDAEGNYIGGFAAPRSTTHLAVDSTGHLYMEKDITISHPGGGASSGMEIIRYDPTTYDPEQDEIAYSAAPVSLGVLNSSSLGSLAVDLTNDHLYINVGGPESIREYGPAVDGVPNPLISDDIATNSRYKGGMAIDAGRQRLYVVESPTNATPAVINVYDSRPPYAQLPELTIDGADTPTKSFSSAKMWLAVDEKNGHLIVADLAEAKRVYEYDEEGNFLGTFPKPPTLEGDFYKIAVDNGSESPSRGYLYVPSGLADTGGRLYAFEPEFEPEPPLVESLSVAGVNETEAVLRATVNPRGAATDWALQYVTQQAFEEEGFASPTLAGQGQLPGGGEGVKVSAPARNLSPGTTYRFRILLENQCQPGGCVVEEQASFTTFRPDDQTGACPNQALRTGASAALPDCRAYELVTPANTAGLQPFAPVIAGSTFATPPTSPAGESFAFLVAGGTIPGTNGSGGGLQGETYRSQRSSSGWETISLGPDGSQAARTFSGGLSADHDYFAFHTFSGGTLHVNGEYTTYVRYPDGSFHAAGEGSFGIEPKAEVLYIAPGATHLLVTTATADSQAKRLQLEPQAPPDGTAAIYDRTPDGVMHVVSLLPGEVTPGAGQDAMWVGASKDGSSVAFQLDDSGTSQIYLRVDNAETQIAAPDGAQFAGLSDDGRYLFYMLGGDLYRFDAESEEAERVTELGDVDPVNIGTAGTAGYFISEVALPTLNPNGDAPQTGALNLYRWGGAALDALEFVGRVTDRDVNGEFGTNGLGLWLQSAVGEGPGLLASRTTPDGSALLFESRADLTTYESGGKAQIYRYDAAAGSLSCLSCSRTGAAPTSGDASLIKVIGKTIGETDPTERLVNSQTVIPNLAPDGRRAFFETPERLLASDNDGVTDVYEWEAQGKGSCAQPGGCLFLISSGQSTRPNHLIGVSESGDDVFILTSDLLVPEDTDETPSVYTARVGGGFAPAPPRAGECLGEACQPAVSASQDRTPASSTYFGAGNAAPEAAKARCPKGKRLARGGKGRGPKARKSRCVKRQKKSKSRKNPNRRASR